MESSIFAGRPQITIVNSTRCAVWVAIYKRPLLHTNEPPVAWQVVSPPPRGNTAVFIPRDYQIYARYSFEPENPRRPVYQTNVLQVPPAPAGAGLVLEGVSSPDRRTWGAVLTRTTQSPGWHQVSVINRFSIAISGHVRQQGHDIFPPRMVPPMTAWTEKLDPGFYVAVLPLPHAAGDLLPDSEISSTETAVKSGESVRIHREPGKGFKISKITPETSSRPIADPDDRTHAQEPRVPKMELKARAKPKADVKKAAPKTSQSAQRRKGQARAAKERTQKLKSKAGKVHADDSI
ncbi:MAG TPA: hypothetical protein VLQ45_31495 [Thermoanaerobaculia bacterium]|nr:hypothetical protein [Thermoanaerobaculia bacterium]